MDYTIREDLEKLSLKLEQLSIDELSRLKNLNSLEDKSDLLSDTSIRFYPQILHERTSFCIFNINSLYKVCHTLLSEVLPGILLVLFTIYLVISSSLLIEWPFESITITTLLFSNISESGSLQDQKCLLDFPQEFTEIVRTPVDNCDFCRNITSIPRVSNITVDQFEQLYASSGRPVIITDVADQWKAMQEFSFNFLKGIYKEDSPLFKDEVYEDCQFFPWKADFSSLKDVFNMSSQQALGFGQPWYVGWSNCDPKVADILRDYYSYPYFLSKESHAGRIDWLFMGSPGFGAPIHIDYVDNTSWQTMIVGDKLWTLIPPSECYWECGPKITALVKKGETIVVNTNIWYHSTKIIGDQMSIAIGSEFD